MRRATSVLLAGSVLGSLGVLVLSSWPSVAQFTGGGTQAVEVSNTVATEARIVGQTVDVTVDGTVALDSASLETLTNATALGNCTYTQGDPSVTIGATPTNIPPSPMASRTAVTVYNDSVATAEILICANDGTPPSASHGIKIRHGGQFKKWEGAQAGWTVSCICAAATCTVAVEEEQCYQ